MIQHATFGQENKERSGHKVRGGTRVQAVSFVPKGVVQIMQLLKTAVAENPAALQNPLCKLRNVLGHHQPILPRDQ
jgi:hypothetical protein